MTPLLASWATMGRLEGALGALSVKPTNSVTEQEFEGAISDYLSARADQNRGLPSADARVDVTRNALQEIEKIITGERNELYRQAAERGEILPRISLPPKKVQ